MEIRVLKYFLTIAREENITRAAEQLHITQPTLSRQIMQLEEELGVRLFQRNRVNVVLTEEGRLLRRRAQEILELAEKETITPADLIGIPLIISKRQSVRNELENWFGEYSRQMQVVAMVSLSYSNRALMVENHVGVALEYEFDFYDDVLCRRPFSPEMCSRSVLVWRKEQVFSSAVTKFIEHVRNEISKL